jgi:hypothetical protein
MSPRVVTSRFGEEAGSWTALLVSFRQEILGRAQGRRRGWGLSRLPFAGRVRHSEYLAKGKVAASSSAAPGARSSPALGRWPRWRGSPKDLRLTLQALTPILA